MGRGICKVCQRFFEKEHDSQIKCKECNKNDKRDYKKVRKYLETHEGATVSDVMRDTGVSFKTLDRFINEERVYLVNNRIISEEE